MLHFLKFYFLSIIKFQQNNGVLYISLLFDSNLQSYPFLGHGYVLRGFTGNGPKGVESLLPIFTSPVVSFFIH